MLLVFQLLNYMRGESSGLVELRLAPGRRTLKRIVPSVKVMCLHGRCEHDEDYIPILTMQIVSVAPVLVRTDGTAEALVWN